MGEVDATANTFAALRARAGKVIAVHINYPSRAAQRGRTPAQPSYFLKPSSSLSPSGSPIERPAGTELLAFEGEIAIVIGTEARRVAPETAWAHVSHVTASNDFGVYDLRWADKGSNLRSKGGDGFTPLGPTLIDARTIDPASLRVRTWLNGAIVQNDTSDTLLFPLALLVSDLSQLLTLEPGDVILTGTPAGASVAKPGDVVEVEVDVPGGASSGRLVTPVIEGTESLPSFSAQPRADDEQRTEAYGSREAAGLPAPFTLDAALRAKLLSVPVAGLSAQLRKRGLNAVTIDGVHANRPGTKLVGLAKTLRFVPAREDLFASHGGGYNAQKRTFDTVKPGEVIVIEARGELGSGTLGDVLALRALTRGAAGIVTDGGVRDYDTVAGIDIPVFSGGPHPAVLGRRHVPWDADITIGCGGTTVQPGDVIVGDGDGVIVIPPGLAEEIADAALAQEDEDAFVAEQVRAGHAVDGLFPMNDEWKARYLAWRAAQ